MFLRKAWFAPLVLAGLSACGGDARTCGTGTIERNGACVVAPATAPLTEITVAHLNVPYDESRPVFVGHRLPLRLGLISRSARPLAQPVPVAVNISLIEHVAGTPDGARQATLKQCFVRTFTAELSGNGEEQLFEPTLEIPRECLPSGTESVTYNFVVQVDPDERALPADAGRAMHFTEAARAALPSDAPQCRSSMDPMAAADGCIHRMIVRASPGTDIAERVQPEGHVALFWLSTERSETRREMMSIQVDRRTYGRDPFDLSSPDADQLPGMVTQRIRITPATGPHAGQYRPLRVQASDPMMPPTEMRQFDRLTPASDNRVEYDLFPTDEVLQLVTTGDWRDVNDFTIEACLEPAFEEQGEDGDKLNEGEEGAQPHSARSDDCRRFSVLGVRAQPAAPTSGSRLDFNREWSRHWGNDKIGLDARLNTENYVIVGGAVSDTTGRVALTSRYLPDITLVDAKAYAGVDLFQPDRTGMELRVDTFGVRALGYERRVPESRELYNRDWSVMKRQCKSARVQVGPVPVGLEGCVQGTLGLNVNVGLYRDMAIEARRFPMHDTEGQIAATVTPYFNVGASASVSVDLLVVRGGVEGQISIIDIRTPLTGSANVGLRRMDPMTMRPSAEANLNVNWNLTLRGLNGRILLFVDTRGIRWCSKKVWFARISYPCGITWDRRGDLTLFTFGADAQTFNLFDRTFANYRLAP